MWGAGWAAAIRGLRLLVYGKSRDIGTIFSFHIYEDTPPTLTAPRLGGEGRGPRGRARGELHQAAVLGEERRDDPAGACGQPPERKSRTR